MKRSAVGRWEIPTMFAIAILTWFSSLVVSLPPQLILLVVPFVVSDELRATFMKGEENTVGTIDRVRGEENSNETLYGRR